MPDAEIVLTPTTLRGTARDVVDDQLALFETFLLDWEREWWGMPAFKQRDATPYQSITMNFYTPEDVVEFGHRLGIKVSRATDSAWFPPDTAKDDEALTLEWADADDAA